MQDFDKEKVKRYIEGLKELEKEIESLIKTIEKVAKDAPVEGCERFMKNIYDSMKNHIESCEGAIEYWEEEISKS